MNKWNILFFFILLVLCVKVDHCSENAWKWPGGVFNTFVVIFELLLCMTASINPLWRSRDPAACVKGIRKGHGHALSLRMNLWRLFGITNGDRESHHSAVLRKEERNKGSRRKERSRGGGERMWALNGGELDLKREGLERWRLNFHTHSLSLSLSIRHILCIFLSYEWYAVRHVWPAKRVKHDMFLTGHSLKRFLTNTHLHPQTHVAHTQTRHAHRHTRAKDPNKTWKRS